MAKDFFLSYASEDRRAVAIPLKEALEKLGAESWFDQHELAIGDSLNQKINDGLNESRFAVVIVSPTSLGKQWPQIEWRAALKLEEDGGRRVLPVLYGVSQEDASRRFPPFADRLSVDASQGDFQGVAIRLYASMTPGGAQPLASALIDFSHQRPPNDEWDDLAGFAQAYGLHMVRSSWVEQPKVLEQASVLLVPPPLRSRLEPSEIDALERWVDNGGGLFVFGHYDLRHHSSNAEELAWRFDFEFGYDVVLAASELKSSSRDWVNGRDEHYAVRASVPAGHPLSDGVSELALIAAASMRSTTGRSIDLLIKSSENAVVKRPLGKIKRDGTRPQIDEWEFSHQGSVPLVAARTKGKGRVIIAGTWKLCTFDLADNRRFLSNAIAWLQNDRPAKRPAAMP